MHTHDLEFLTIDYTSDSYLAAYINSDFYYNAVQNIIDGFTKRKLYTELFKMYGEISGLEGAAILNAHGNTKHGVWEFRNGSSFKKVQDWVDIHDKSKLVLFIATCNPKASSISSEHSIIVHANEAFSAVQLATGKVNTCLYLPGKGYLQNSKQLRNAIENMKKNS